MQNKNLREVAALFFKLGCIGFGGPIVHIAMMRREVVERRGWMSDEHFLDLVGATNLIPGPNSTEMTMHCGRERAGVPGLVTAGLCFITPAVLLTGLIAWAYQQYGRIPQVSAFVEGMKPATVAVLLFLLRDIGKKALKNTILGLLGVAVLAGAMAGVSAIGLLFGAGFLYTFWQNRLRGSASAAGLFPLLWFQTGTAGAASAWQLGWIFLKIGSLLYGSGYVLFAFLDTELVAKGLLSRSALLDAVAVGQFTPGPVFSAATFVGWQIGGWSGAAAASVGIFLPAFVFSGLLHLLLPRLRASEHLSAFLDGVNIASVALILAVGLQGGAEMLGNRRLMLIGIAAFTTLWLKPDLNTAFVVLGGGLAGVIDWI